MKNLRLSFLFVLLMVITPNIDLFANSMGCTGEHIYNGSYSGKFNNRIAFPMFAALYVKGVSGSARVLEGPVPD